MDPIERKGLLDFHGTEVTVIGPDLDVGQPAPEFEVVGNDWTKALVLESTRGKVRIIGSLPSISSSTCDRETRRFNQEAASLGEGVRVIMVSMDLPWTNRGWCAAAGIERVQTFSDAPTGEFGEKYGVLLKEPRIFRRAIFVVDPEDRVAYADYMPTIGTEPNYAAVLAAAKRALGTPSGA